METAEKKEKELRLLFIITLTLKGFFSLLEIISGLAILFISKSDILSNINTLASTEAGQDENNPIWDHVSHTAQTLSISSQHFAIIYLLSHGIVKLFLIVNLIRGKLWAYPFAVAAFSLFILYELYRYFHTHSIWLLVLVFFDALIVALTIHEWRFANATSSPSSVEQPR